MKLYYACPTIEEYVLVNTRFPMIEVHYKEDGKWVYSVFDEQDEVTLTGLSVHFPCAAVYEDIDFAGNEPTVENLDFL